MSGPIKQTDYYALASETVQIDKKVYKELLDNSRWAASLEAAGVDNWDGYGEARRIYQETTNE